MIDQMPDFSLEWLKSRIDPKSPLAAEAWYRALREDAPQRLLPYLVEPVDDTGGDERYYTLSADPSEPDLAVLEVHDLKPGDGAKLPFNQPSGSQSAAIGPVIKRTAPASAKPAGPSQKIRDTTLKAFSELAVSGAAWAGYFGRVAECWSRKRLRLTDGTVIDAPTGAYDAAVGAIDEKNTVFLAYRDGSGRCPGEVPEYAAYLQGVLAPTKYTTGVGVVRAGQTCTMCGREGVHVYPNVMRGAGINLSNLDRDGSFPGLDPSAAWKAFAPCLACADLLYVFCKHVSASLVCRVAGEYALVVPSLDAQPAARAALLSRHRDWVVEMQKGGDGLRTREHHLLRLLGDDRAVTQLTFVWANFANRIEDVAGVVTDVLPTRLRAIVERTRQFGDATAPGSESRHPAFPEYELQGFEYDLSLNVLLPLLRRPGGKAAQRRNESRRLFSLRRDITAAIYHGEPIDEGRLWAELLETAVWHFADVITADEPVYRLTCEGFSKKKGPFLTLAGWVRQVAKFLHYGAELGVLPAMADSAFQPQLEQLRPYFGPETRIDSREKAFAFILGVLFGKLVQVQAARGVNVGSNSLTWLRRLTLAGRDLPELYVKVRGKIQEYQTESNADVRAVISELSELGVALGTDIRLDTTETCYFLLLGQSLSGKILPSRAGEERKKIETAATTA